MVAVKQQELTEIEQQAVASRFPGNGRKVLRLDETDPQVEGDIETRPVREALGFASKAVTGYSINTIGSDVAARVPPKYEQHVWGLIAIGWITIIILIIRKRQKGQEVWLDTLANFLGLVASLSSYLP